MDGLAIIRLRETFIERLRLGAGDPSKLLLWTSGVIGSRGWTLIFIVILGVMMTQSKSKEGLITSKMIHQAPSKAQFVVQRVHSTSPQQRSEYGSGSNRPISLLVQTKVLLLVMPCMIRQVHT